jgi:hypothetical protein
MDSPFVAWSRPSSLVEGILVATLSISCENTSLLTCARGKHIMEVKKEEGKYRETLRHLYALKQLTVLSFVTVMCVCFASHLLRIRGG